MWVVVPVKPFVYAKRRLAGVLSDGERAALARAMLHDLFTLLARCSRVSGVLCVTREAGVATLASICGAEVLPREIQRQAATPREQINPDRARRRARGASELVAEREPGGHQCERFAGVHPTLIIGRDRL